MKSTQVVTLCIMSALSGSSQRADTPREPRVITVQAAGATLPSALEPLVDEIRQRADAFVFVSGGASKMSEAHQTQLLAMFDALAMLAKEGRRLAIGDGGTKAGIMEATGRARLASGRAFPLIGVAPAREIPPKGSTPADPNHSHLVAVETPHLPKGAPAWGAETETMYALFARMAAGRPSVTVVANGGGIVLKEVEANVAAGRTMILVEGSGRAADALVSLLKGTIPTDDEVSRLRAEAEAAKLTRRPDLYRLVPLDTGARGLADAIRSLIAR